MDLAWRALRRGSRQPRTHVWKEAGDMLLRDGPCQDGPVRHFAAERQGQFRESDPHESCGTATRLGYWRAEAPGSCSSSATRPLHYPRITFSIHAGRQTSAFQSTRYILCGRSKQIALCCSNPHCCFKIYRSPRFTASCPKRNTPCRSLNGPSSSSGPQYHTRCS